VFSDIKIRAYRPQDVVKLKKFLEESDVSVDLELPHGFVGQATETAVAERDKELLCSITGTLAVVLDPLIKNPNAKAIDLMPAIIQAARALEFYGTMHGVTEAFLAVPGSIPVFQRIVERAGYERTADDCAIYRRLLVENDSCMLKKGEEEDTSHESDDPSDV